MKPIRPAPKAIIIENGRLLAVKMRDKVGYWYLLPGGGIRTGETLEEGLRREVREEVGVEIAIGPLRFVRDYIAQHHEFAEEDGDAHQVEYMFVCRITDRANFGSGTEPDPGQLGLEWLGVDALEGFRLYPKALRPLISRMDETVGAVYMGDVN